MIGEEHSEKIVNFSLVPVGAVVEAANGRNGCGFVCVGLDPNARVVSNAQHVVHNFESLISCRVVNSCDVGNLGELGCGVVLEEVEDGDHALRWDVDDKLIFPD